MLSYEILLLSLFSYVQWHHFAYLVVSIALLGFGTSGSLLVFIRGFLHNRFRAFALSQTLMFAVAAPLCFALAQRLAFNPEELIWDPLQWLRLALTILLLMLPFLFAANFIGLALYEYRRQLARVYAADLLGAGLGAGIAIGMLYLTTTNAALGLVALLGCAAAAAVWLEGGARPWLPIAGFAALGLIWGIMPADWIAPRISPYKELSQLLRINGTQVVAQRHSPLGVTTLVESEMLPLRHAPGLSLLTQHEPPAQLGLFSNAGAMSAVTRYRGDPAEIAYLDDLTSALAYHLLAPRRVLVLGAGGGADLLQALYHDAEQIDAVELNAQVITLLRGEFADFSGNLYRHPRIAVAHAEAREFLLSSPRQYDLIQVPSLDSFAAAGAGVHGLNENFIYTIEALQLMLSRIDDKGVVSLTRWLKLPPRDSLKLFATAIAALERISVAQPGRHLILIRGLQTATLLIGKAAFEREQIERVKAFCAPRGFDLAYYPGMPAAEANRYNRLQRDYFFDGAKRLLGPQRKQFLQDYKFNLEPASDDRPFHFHFVKWTTLGELLALRQRGGSALIETGYLTLLLAFALSIGLSLLLILAPLGWLRREPAPAPAVVGSGKLRVLAYFAALGLGFLLIEIAFLQKFILLLHHPTYAAATVLASFLLAAGAGAAQAQRLLANRRLAARLALALIVGIGAVYLMLLPNFLQFAASWSLTARIALCAGLIAPLGFCMGMPFPLGLAVIADRAGALIPWAWGINGCCSVISAVLASLLAIHFGFNAVIGIGLICYAGASLFLPRAAGD